MDAPGSICCAVGCSHTPDPDVRTPKYTRSGNPDSQPMATWITPCSSLRVYDAGTSTRRQIIGLMSRSRTLSCRIGEASLDLLRGGAARHEALRCHVAAASLHALETAGYPSLPRFCMLSAVGRRRVPTVLAVYQPRSGTYPPSSASSPAALDPCATSRIPRGPPLTRHSVCLTNAIRFTKRWSRRSNKEGGIKR